jgi:hypothetical protein
VVAALVLGAVLGFVLLLAYAGHACAVDQPSSPCPDAAAHRATVVALASLSAGLLVTPFALLAEFAVRRRILYRGAWGRATRRGTLTALGIAAIAGLRLGDALSVPSGLFVISLLAAMEWLAVRRFDLP